MNNHLPSAMASPFERRRRPFDGTSARHTSQRRRRLRVLGWPRGTLAPPKRETVPRHPPWPCACTVRSSAETPMDLEIRRCRSASPELAPRVKRARMPRAGFAVRGSGSHTSVVGGSCSSSSDPNVMRHSPAAEGAHHPRELRRREGPSGATALETGWADAPAARCGCPRDASPRARRRGNRAGPTASGALVQLYPSAA